MHIEPVTLTGTHVRLLPLTLAHCEALSRVGLDPALWERTTIRVQTPADMLSYVQTALQALAAGTALPFVIALQPSDEIIGTTRYHSIVREHRRLEIGYTWITARWQRTAVNTEAKYLLLRHAFEHWRCQRVEFKVDSENEPSCRGLLRIGAQREGTLRRYMESAHRGPRDVAIFSIVESEWDAVKARLQDRLEAGTRAAGADSRHTD